MGTQERRDDRNSYELRKPVGLLLQPSGRMEVDRPVDEWPEVNRRGLEIASLQEGFARGLLAKAQPVRLYMRGKDLDIAVPALKFEDQVFLISPADRRVSPGGVADYPRFTPTGASKEKPTIYTSHMAARNSKDVKTEGGVGSGERALPEMQLVEPHFTEPPLEIWDDIAQETLVLGGME